MSPIRMSKIESAIRVVLTFHEAFNRHDIDRMMQLISPDCVFEVSSPAPDGSVYAGKDAIAQFLENFFAENPQAHIDIEEIFGMGKRCIMRWRSEWINVNGETKPRRGVDIYLVKEDLICEKLSYVKA